MSVDLDWLNLLEVSGPFLAEPVLKQAFPDGLDLLERGVPQRLRATYDEWRNAVDVRDPDLSLFHEAWIDEVLAGALEFDETCIRKGSELPKTARANLPEHGVHLEADIAIVDPSKPDVPLLLISTYAPDTDLDTVFEKDGLAATPADRMVTLLRRTECPIGLVTNGERWMLVHAPSGSVASYTSWYARLWGQERETLRAFVSLLGIRRLTGPVEDALPKLFERSLAHQGDVTDALGGQVAQAIEVLMRALDRADQDRNRELLKGIPPETIYEAGLTLMMRLVFILSAEERGLLLLGDPSYDAHYAISSLRAQLAEEDAKVLEHRMSAWSRILATFRAVYAGIGHPDLHMPAMGGSLFDPDRFEFLEGRKRGTTWRTEPADPLPIDDRTVLLLLEAIQILKGRTLSYRALDVEQIGHVYEGLLERTVDHVHGVTLQLKGSAGVGTCLLSLRGLEQARESGEDALFKLLEEKTGRSASALQNELSEAAEQNEVSGLLSSCRGDVELRDRILPFVRLTETDPWGFPLVHHEGAIVVVHGSDRRETGTHYTPKSLTEKIVTETLVPVVYRGPAEGVPRAEWQLKTPAEILDLKICDPAMGSGAFLVQVCRWLAERLLESWASEEDEGRHIDVEGLVLDDANEVSEPLPRDPEERATLARRMIAEKCLYGVDMNPLAVELAKLSLWLTTLAKGRPFGFLDHNLKSGDSLLGISDLEQLIELDMNPKQSGQLRLFGRSIRKSVEEATVLRSRLREIPVRDITDVEAMAQLDGQSRRILDLPKLVADAFVGGVLANKKVTDRTARIETIAALSDDAAAGYGDAAVSLERIASEDLALDEPNGRPRRSFHWPLEFPEVFRRENGGFDAIVGNPPFVGGQRITGAMGTAFRDWLVSVIAEGRKGSADLVAYFFLRTASLLREGGDFGLLATSTIAEGDTRQIGLEAMLHAGLIIYSAYPNEKWPGAASVVTSRVHVRKGIWLGQKSLAGQTTTFISAFLSDREEWSPKKLKANEGRAFIGSYVLGKGFILSADDAAQMIAVDPRNSDVLFPYLNGQDLNTNPLQKTHRWVINLWDWPSEVASTYTAPWQWIKEHVKPERDKLNQNNADGRKRKKYWWLYGRDARGLYFSIGRAKKSSKETIVPITPSDDKSSVVCIARVSKYVSPSFVENKSIFSEQVVVLSDCKGWTFEVLSSSVFEFWAINQSSNLGATMRFTPSDSFETFPFPLEPKVPYAHHAKRLHDEIREIMSARKVGLTSILNQLHDPGKTSEELKSIRSLYQQLTSNILHSYGWNDLQAIHDFRQVPYLPENDCVRFTISEENRLEVLLRLAELNRERYQEEVEQGLHGNLAKPQRKKTATRKKKQAVASAPTLDLEPTAPVAMVESPKVEKPEPPIERLYNWLYNQNGKWVPKNQAASAIGLSTVEFEQAISTLVAEGDLLVRTDGEDTLLRVEA
ncbi:Eco57I restriction-modification methylase domain-containing protein [Ruegeria faecimaris]|uniref:Eco57I restriction-modification methylase domain-containing protein n=1 Tax=Ruegeria faecimaris TaxID=686389 RepID=UPI0024934D17|nr:type IIL restriction-modification enzyme MmeI [Ruegeria faecimaris]